MVLKLNDGTELAGDHAFKRIRARDVAEGEELEQVRDAVLNVVTDETVKRIGDADALQRTMQWITQRRR